MFIVIDFGVNSTSFAVLVFPSENANLIDNLSGLKVDVLLV